MATGTGAPSVRGLTCASVVSGRETLFLEVALEETTFELGFEMHRGLPGGWGLGGHGKGLLTEGAEQRGPVACTGWCLAS